MDHQSTSEKQDEIIRVLKDIRTILFFTTAIIVGVLVAIAIKL